MEQMWPYLVLVVVLSFSHLVQGMTGFGAVVLALPILSLFFPIKTLVPSLVVVNFLQTAYFAVRERRYIDRKQTASILGLSLLGLPVGYFLFRSLPADQLKLSLGIFVVAVGAWNLARLRTRRGFPDWLYHFLNLGGGIAQGSMASGGALVVIYAAKWIEDKTAFRATLSLAWAVLNLALLATYTATGAWERDMLVVILPALPCILFGTALGIHYHDRIPEKPFHTAVYILLLVSGLALVRPYLFSLLG